MCTTHTIYAQYLVIFFYLQDEGGQNKLSDEYIRTRAMIYGRQPGKKMTPYYEEMNKAAYELALEDPNLLLSRQELVNSARTKVNEVYKFKKGKSRSKQQEGSSSSHVPKRQKTTESIRAQHIGELEEDIKDINDQLQFKEKRREQAELARNYKLCDQLTEEMSSLKKQKREREEELRLWKRKQQQGSWYKKRSRLSTSTSDSDIEQHSRSSTTAPSTPQSSRGTSPYQSVTPSPAEDRIQSLTAESPLSSLSCHSSAQESECIHRIDTNTLSQNPNVESPIELLHTDHALQSADTPIMDLIDLTDSENSHELSASTPGPVVDLAGPSAFQVQLPIPISANLPRNVEVEQKILSPVVITGSSPLANVSSSISSAQALSTSSASTDLTDSHNVSSPTSNQSPIGEQSDGLHFV